MVLNTQPIENYQPQTVKTWKWEKKHWLLMISIACLTLWWFSPSLKENSWMKSSLSYLPMIGGLALVSEQLLRLI